MSVLNTSVVGFSCFTAYACAKAIAARARAFESSTASAECDPFHFAPVLAANAQVRTAQMQLRYAAPTCWSEPRFSGPRASSPMCKRG
jgi:hypothetical protein